MGDSRPVAVQIGPDQWQVADGDSVATFVGASAAWRAGLYADTLHRCSAGEMAKRLPVVTDPDLCEVLEDLM